MNQVSTLSIDLAKNVFQLLAVDKHGKPCFSRRINRQKLKETIQNMPPCKVVMEACGCAHYWGRMCIKAGHKAHLVPAQHVTPFVRGNKNDKNDCLAIYEASQRPYIRFVPVKSESQQAVLLLHRMRERLIKARTACLNQTRSFLLEFGIETPKSYRAFYSHIQTLLDQQLQPVILLLIHETCAELRAFERQLRQLDSLFRDTNQRSQAAEIMQSLPGVGPIIASAFSASIDKGQAFNSAKEFDVWLGFTPKQYASADKSVLSHITKRGDRYLRKQLIHGARTVVTHAHKKDDDLNRWISTLKERIGINKTIVATAHRLARLMWILLQKNEPYQPQYTQSGAAQCIKG
ncbi:IS110 family transposase [Pseudoalteromonas sp. DL2-H2.2]|uniref:IS110 family transposase n=1 Tax=Pseudoalteromonas sp. DL2-H2.2 TaxID=2908889 RepID=UPI001F39EA52|nr:IS110 family transposase [Pseudoalteromonas sp. DL2-H2.2]MCF2910717.1 IS110 family transposase [Pseudoalteromonas sp. DL2-H2.2]